MGPLNRGEDSLLFKDIVHNNRWDWGRLSFVFPSAFRQKIKATSIPIVTGGADRLSWSSSPNGDFELKEAYRLACLTEKSNQFDSFMGSWVWEVLMLPKIKCFLWQCVHQSILVRVVLTEWGYNLSSLRPLCNEAIESIIHVLRDCPKAHLLWNSFPPPIQSNTFYGVHLGDWLHISCKSQHPSLLGIP